MPYEAKVPSQKIRQRMHIYTIGEQEICFFYFFNPYNVQTSVKTTFKGKKFNKAAIKCNLLTGFFNIYMYISIYIYKCVYV